MLTEKEFDEKLYALRTKLPALSSDMASTGRHPSLFGGSGYTVKGITEYDPWVHDVSDIDHELSAQEADKHLLVRTFFDEDERSSYFVIDTSASMFFGDKIDTALLSVWYMASVYIIDGPVSFLRWGANGNIVAVRKEISGGGVRKTLSAWRTAYREKVRELTEAIAGIRKKIIENGSVGETVVSFLCLKGMVKQKTVKANLVIVSDFITNEDFTEAFRFLRSAGFSVSALCIRDSSEEHAGDAVGLDVGDPESVGRRVFFGKGASQKKVQECIEAQIEGVRKSCSLSGAQFEKITGCEGDIALPLTLLLKRNKK